MNNKQRVVWDNLVQYAARQTLPLTDEAQQAILTTNAYILKLERELQNIKTGKRIAKILLPKQDVV